MALLYEKRGKIAQITIDRPRALNSLDPQTFKELSDALISYRDDNDLWAAILTGSGNRAFCVGVDIKDMLPMLGSIRNEWWRLPPTILRGLELWKPIIAAVNGHALGGGLELALACDLTIMVVCKTMLPILLFQKKRSNKTLVSLSLKETG